ncbi:MAG: ankyrin repeat domain-containing protein, partial [Candidatus Rhabdochlamydia sp.]
MSFIPPLSASSYSALPCVSQDEKNKQLFKAVQQGDLAGVDALISSGVNPNIKNPYGWTLLCQAVGSGHTEIVRLLIEKGADLNIPDEGCQTPLHKAAMYGHTEIVRLLIEK